MKFIYGEDIMTHDQKIENYKKLSKFMNGVQIPATCAFCEFTANVIELTEENYITKIQVAEDVYDLLNPDSTINLRDYRTLYTVHTKEVTTIKIGEMSIHCYQLNLRQKKLVFIPSILKL